MKTETKFCVECIFHRVDPTTNTHVCYRNRNKKLSLVTGKPDGEILLCADQRGALLDSCGREGKYWLKGIYWQKGN